MALRHLAAEVGTTLRVRYCGPPIHIWFSFELTRSMSTGREVKLHKLWRELFSDPSQWWDYRTVKVNLDFDVEVNPKFPDFKHKTSQDGLWLIDSLNPPWVEAELAAVAPGTLQADIVSWNKRLSRHVKDREFRETLELYYRMQKEGIKADGFTFVPVLKACSGLRALEEGRSIHMKIKNSGCGSDVFVDNALVDMYVKCRSIEEAQEVFNKMPMRDVVSWNVMILGHVKCGQAFKALQLSQQMNEEKVEPDPATFVGMLNACAAVIALEEGRRVHQQILERHYESDVYVANSLIDMYAKCGSIEDAWRVFIKMRNRSVVSWNAMVLGLVQHGAGEKALELLDWMRAAGVDPNPVTFVGLLNACASVAALEEGRHLHEQVVQRGWESDIYVGSSLINMYAKCGRIEDAWRLFNKMSGHDVVAWSAMISGFVKCGKGQKALELFGQMQEEGVAPNAVTFASVLNACASIAALEEGRLVHKQLSQSRWVSNNFVQSCLVDMYAKCGSIEDAQRVFLEMPTRDAVSWNSMLGGYAMHGRFREALEHFERMHQEGIEMNGITFLSVLSACSHGGLVNEGMHYFESMNSVHSVSRTLEHYERLVDLLSRGGHLHEAEELIKTMPCEPNASDNIWMSMLGACRVHGNVEIGERVGKQVLDLDPHNVTGYVLLSSIYAAKGMWDRSARLNRERLQRHVKRAGGSTWISVNNKVQSFTSGDCKHPQILEIHAELERLSGQMKEAGYTHDLTFVLDDIKKGNMEVHFCHHTDKLAIAFGLISTSPCTPLHIFSNLRMCDDCHNAIKLIAKIVERRIIVRDVNRFHHFQDGLCSCKDYW